MNLPIPESEIKTEYDEQENLWVASIPSIKMFGYGDTLKKALTDLQECTEEYYDKIKDGINLGPIPTRDLEIMKGWIEMPWKIEFELPEKGCCRGCPFLPFFD